MESEWVVKDQERIYLEISSFESLRFAPLGENTDFATDLIPDSTSDGRKELGKQREHVTRVQVTNCNSVNI